MMEASVKPPVLRCLVVDDESFAIEGVVGLIQKVNYLTVVGTCSSAIEASDFLRREEVDLMFLDINMPDLTGLEFLESLDNPPITIFTTAYSEYALDGFRLNVVDYLLKPISFQRFFQAVQKALELYTSRLTIHHNTEEIPSDMYIRQGDSFIKISWEDILYVESMQNYLKLQFKDKSFVIHQTMSSLEEMLPRDAFFRIHKSFLVNVAHIELISGGRVFVNGKELPLSKHRREELFNTVVNNKLISK
ncbi:DNA-binding LytR/AlgR family response regulator [Parabacteroides sp. PFB2-12]|uniref:LytR/AlgR family response regulator transcription factor n=1 Tax=unclassified Parabacteroides TaxID=2649774 RepID=UPI00247640B3|nr:MULTISPECIES: LytTR family DNA-binding domain-containing protein [unclassified Parabacteroides]MDH6342643.1 DNA-binding LytR/AlgR family response regulator [Parabacteroides sp. PM6-13]MDH6391772.1 DNA-binding LytR/AlgR family response regulator [Parabacteroides sp. PFB2-12]